jgi:enamine deaminase RidA (YjgF/YER057c/UK114 family)
MGADTGPGSQSRRVRVPRTRAAGRRPSDEQARDVGAIAGARLTVLQPPHWPKPKGYSNGMLGRGAFVVVGGQIGWDEQGRFAQAFTAQVAQTLRNILAVLAEAGGNPEHIARMTWYVVDMDEYRASLKALGPIWREVMGRHYPAIAVVGVTALVEPEARVEIEATAILPE